MNTTKYNLQLIKKPPCDHRTGKCADEDRPALRRYQGVTNYMRTRGCTEAEAIALYDRPRGICKCGAEAPGKGRECHECMLTRQRAKQAQYRAEKRFMKPKQCQYPGCEVVFLGWRRRKFCDLHIKDGRAKKYNVKPKLVKAKLPPTWEKPRSTAALANKRFTQHVAAKAPEPVVERIVNPGVQVTRIPSAFADWRAINPEDLDRAKCAAVAEINEKRGWR